MFISYHYWMVVHCMDIPLFIHFFVEGHLGCSQIGVIMNKSAFNICVQVFVHTYIFHIYGIYYWHIVGSLQVLAVIAIRLTTNYYFTSMYQDTARKPLFGAKWTLGLGRDCYIFNKIIFSLLPRNTVNLHYTVSFAISYEQLLEFQPVEYENWWPRLAS